MRINKWAMTMIIGGIVGAASIYMLLTHHSAAECVVRHISESSALSSAANRQVQIIQPQALDIQSEVKANGLRFCWPLSSVPPQPRMGNVIKGMQIVRDNTIEIAVFEPVKRTVYAQDVKLWTEEFLIQSACSRSDAAKAVDEIGKVILRNPLAWLDNLSMTRMPKNGDNAASVRSDIAAGTIAYKAIMDGDIHHSAWRVNASRVASLMTFASDEKKDKDRHRATIMSFARESDAVWQVRIVYNGNWDVFCETSKLIMSSIDIEEP